MDHHSNRKVSLHLAIMGVLAALAIGATGGWMIGIGQPLVEEWTSTPAAVFSDGQWTVGTDVVDGIYVLEANAGPDCAYGTTTAGVEDTAPTPTPDGRVRLLLKRGDVVTTKGCGIWQKE